MFLAWVNLSGDAGETEIIEISAANYTVNIAAGSILEGTDHDGIFTTFGFTLNNSGTISGFSPGASFKRQGIDVFTGAATTVINNFAGGTISTSHTYGIWFRTDGGTVNNAGLIEGELNSGGVNTNDENEGKFGPNPRFPQPGGVSPTGS